MKQEDAKYNYKVESTMDLEEVLETIFEQLGEDSAEIHYFSLSEDDLVKKEMKKEELIKKALDLRNESSVESPSIVFPDAEIIVYEDEGEIDILSKVKLDLSEIDEVVEE